MATVFITKYALTRGIISEEIDRVIYRENARADEGPQYVKIAKRSHSLYRVGTEAFEHYDEALANEQRRIHAKIDSLEKQLNGLRRRLNKSVF